MVPTLIARSETQGGSRAQTHLDPGNMPTLESITHLQGGVPCIMVRSVPKYIRVIDLAVSGGRLICSALRQTVPTIPNLVSPLTRHSDQ